MSDRFEPTWESLGQYSVPEWYKDAKLGIFIHWGVYSVPAFDNEWYPRHMYRREHPAFAHHRDTWGPQSEFGYKDFIPMFRAEKWDPEACGTNLKRALGQWNAILGVYASGVWGRPIELPFDPPDDLLEQTAAYLEREAAPASPE